MRLSLIVAALVALAAAPARGERGGGSQAARARRQRGPAGGCPPAPLWRAAPRPSGRPPRAHWGSTIAPRAASAPPGAGAAAAPARSCAAGFFPGRGVRRRGAGARRGGARAERAARVGARFPRAGERQPPAPAAGGRTPARGRRPTPRRRPPADPSLFSLASRLHHLLPARLPAADRPLLQPRRHLQIVRRQVRVGVVRRYRRRRGEHGRTVRLVLPPAAPVCGQRVRVRLDHVVAGVGVPGRGRHQGRDLWGG